MFKNKVGRKFSRETDQRAAFIKSLSEALILHGRITTTEARAKELRGVVERYITKAKVDNFNTIRYLQKYVGEKASKKLVKEIGPKYKDRKGGYTRVIKLAPRMSDSAKMAIIELI